MGKNHDYLKATLWALASLLLVIGLGYSYSYYEKEKEFLYEQEFHSLSAMARIGGEIETSDCTKIYSKIKVTEDAVILSLNGDTLSGIPVSLSADGGLEVQFTDTLLITIYKADPNNDGNVILIIVGPGQTLLLSQTEDCEDITALMDKIKE